MSANIPNNLPGLEKLIRRISAAEKSNQREIRISIQEARELNSELAVLTANLGKTVTEIYQILNDIKESTTNIDIKFDGGDF